MVYFHIARGYEAAMMGTWGRKLQVMVGREIRRIGHAKTSIWEAACHIQRGILSL
jgi:hypothetical protein